MHGGPLATHVQPRFIAKRTKECPMEINEKIRQIVPGRSFVDIGGLWGTENERATVASAAGARSVMMVDMAEEGNEWWRAFEDRCKARGVLDCKNVVANLDHCDFASRVPVTDIVHCSGVIYHVPSPIRTLSTLRQVTGNLLLLCSMTVPGLIETDVGSIDMSGGTSIFVPALDGHKREIVCAYFDRMGIQIPNINAAVTYPWRLGADFNYAPWWWLWTPRTLVALVETAGFRVLEIFDGWPRYSHYLVCERV
jgi:hypothetical protein